MPKRVIAGLGNPGSEYTGTRHNIGFSLVDAFSSRHGGVWKKQRRYQAETAEVLWREHSLLLVKPLTYMNKSGLALQSLCSFYRIPPEQVLVIYDEYQLPLGSVKVSLRGSSGGHNGVASVKECLGDGFIRYRVGIGSDKPTEMPLTTYVLGKFSETERAILARSNKSLLDGLELLIDKGPVLAMNQLNQRKQPDEFDHFNTL